jgi:hypothetical protein
MKTIFTQSFPNLSHLIFSPQINLNLDTTLVHESPTALVLMMIPLQAQPLSGKIALTYARG